MYYVYILRCLDGTLYTGITTDIYRRFKEHSLKGTKAAKYTRVHGVKKIEAFWNCNSRSLASQLEFRLKSLSKQQKENIIKDNKNLTGYLGEKIELSAYQRILEMDI